MDILRAGRRLLCSNSWVTNGRQNELHHKGSRRTSVLSAHMIKEYDEVPGPKPWPLLGNTWRFIPYLGNYKISELNRISERLHAEYGDVVKISNLLGRPDMVFLFDASEIEKVFRSEDALPFRPSMPSLDYYKHVLRKDFFSEIGGVIATHGEKWHNFRSKVQQPMLQPRTAKLYTSQIEETADEFVQRIRTIRDSSNYTVPGDFLNEIHKWSLESIAKVALDVKLGCLVRPSEDTQDLIDAVNTFFKNVVVLELKVPFWKLFNTPTWNTYIKSLDTITRSVNARQLVEGQPDSTLNRQITVSLLRAAREIQSACLPTELINLLCKIASILEEEEEEDASEEWVHKIFLLRRDEEDFDKL